MENHDVLSVPNQISPQRFPAVDNITSHFHQGRSRSSSCAPRNLGTQFISLSMPSSPIKVQHHNQGAELFSNTPRNKKLVGKGYESFKTWFENIERQPSQWHRKVPDTEEKQSSWTNTEIENVPGNISFDDLEVPETGTLTVSEDLPGDTVLPFLLRFPVLWFGMCLGISSQALMWKLLASSTSTRFLHVSLAVNLTLWCMSSALLCIISFIYLLKMFIYFKAVSLEFHHPIRVNFFFAPWTTFLFLALSIPPSISQNPLHKSIWYILMAPIFCMDVKIYGHWMSGGKRSLSKVANPSNHLAVVGNFLGALLGASMGLKEGPLFFFAIGLAHYIVLFVTLYQRLPTNDTVVSKELQPVFFMFLAGPCAASMAWAEIQGSLDYGSRIAYFIGIFLYVSLVSLTPCQ